MIGDSIDVKDLAPATGGQGYAAFDDDLQFIHNDGPPQPATDDVLSKAVPAGNYAIFGKVEAFNGNAGGDVICRTYAGADFDEAVAHVPGGRVVATETMTVVHASASQFTIHLACDADGTGASQSVKFAKITALRLRSLVNTPK